MKFSGGNKVRDLPLIELSESNLLAQVELLLRNWKKIENHQDVVAMEISGLNNGIYTIKVAVREETIVESKRHG